ncbi:hypothetical protein [Brevibacillus porteri]|uniref:hypothetical protein n=1 Tax=Brevibacillus porteri TaxID=2126350 RepID=UPI00363E56FA
MLLEQADKPFSDGRYVFEPKIDGHRLILSRSNGQTPFIQDNNDVSAKYPELVMVVQTWYWMVSWRYLTRTLAFRISN